MYWTKTFFIGLLVLGLIYVAAAKPSVCLHRGETREPIEHVVDFQNSVLNGPLNFATFGVMGERSPEDAVARTNCLDISPPSSDIYYIEKIVGTATRPD